MHSKNKEPALIDSTFLSGWGYFAAASIALLLIDFFVLPVLLNTNSVQPLVLPVIQTICQYSALFFGIVAIVKIINANIFKHESGATGQKTQ